MNKRLTLLGALCATGLLLAACATAPPPTSTPPEAPAARDEALHALAQAEAALAVGDLEQAAYFLMAADADLPPAALGRYREARETLAALRDDPGARTLKDVARSLEGRDAIDSAGAVEILQRLERVPSTRLQAAAMEPTRLGQWAALAVDVRRTLLEKRDLLEAARDWTVLHPLHPVDEQAYLEITWQYGQRFTPPGRIAVLLPTEGSLAAAGAAIRDGIVAAWLENPARSELTFLPLGEDPYSAVTAYRQAERDGYQWVIGPLRKETVQQVVELPGASLPGLLLNWPDPPPTTGPFDAPGAAATPAARNELDFFSLSLSQEAEAQAVAERMLRDGHRRAILLLSDNAWGERSEAAFVDAYLAGGGEVVALERFRSGDADHSEKLTRLLQIEDGRERRRRLQSLLNLPLEFEDSRRDDFGAFFMAADPVLGRQLKPQLRFFDAGDKPVFAMSRIYTGQLDPTADTDLNGVVIPTTRWALRPDRETHARFASEREGSFSPLHALGRDAWNLLPWLELMARDREFAYPGAIGNLSLGNDGRLLRDPAWAVFRGGRPQPLDDPG